MFTSCLLEVAVQNYLKDMDFVSKGQEIIDEVQVRGVEHIWLYHQQHHQGGLEVCVIQKADR